MKSEILDIYEITNEKFKQSGVISPHNYQKIFCAYVRYFDGTSGTLYFGWRQYNVPNMYDYGPNIEGKEINHYDTKLFRAIEKFGIKYRNEILSGANIKTIIQMDAENTLNLNIPHNQEGFVKKLIKKIKKETN